MHNNVKSYNKYIIFMQINLLNRDNSVHLPYALCGSLFLCGGRNQKPFTLAYLHDPMYF